MGNITPFLWFDNQAEAAAAYYVSIFPNSSVKQVTHYTEATAAAAHQDVGTAMVVSFNLNGMDFLALNGGPLYKFNESISFTVGCKDQAEIDRYWEKLSADSDQEQCGWCRDKFGLSWQIVPDNMSELMSTPAACAAMMKMKKIIIADLVNAK